MKTPIALLLLALALPARAGTLAQFDFDGANTWPSAGSRRLQEVAERTHTR